ncbi:KRSC protein, partial [Alaudala cheleensis]|nr:KRSC protein [Alaudala cheleensis]
SCDVSCPQPCAWSRSLEPCVASCGDSRAVVFPPPVVLTFPGPTLSTCSQESVVGASNPMILGGPTPNFSDQSTSSFGSGGFPGSSAIGGSFGVGGGSFG